MISQPRFVILFFYGLGWCIVPTVILTGAPPVILLFVILIQLVNIFSVLRMPVRVCVRKAEIECYFPLTRTTKTFDLSATEYYPQRNPLRLFAFSDFLVLRSRAANVQIWRMATGDLDGICEALEGVSVAPTGSPAQSKPVG